MDSKARLLVAVAVMAATPACLPRGNPPAGRQLIADRSASLGAVVPPNGDGMLRILVMRPSADGDGEDLSVLELDAASKASAERTLIKHIAPESSLGCTWKVAPCAFDASGRVRVYPNDRTGAWLDPVTGDLKDDTPYAYRSDSQARSFGWSIDPGSGGTATATLYDGDGHATPIDLALPNGTATFAFAGEDFYYVTDQNVLMDIPPSDVPAQVTTGVTAVRSWKTPEGSLLLLEKAAAPDPNVTPQWVVRDPLTGIETPLPFDASEASQSPDGTWLLHLDLSADDSRFTLIDYHLDPPKTVDVPRGYAIFPNWRPGTSEFWVTTYDADTGPTVWVLQPDAPPVSVPGVALENVFLAGGTQVGPFTPDGAYWFSAPPGPTAGAPLVQVAPVADLTGPRVNMNPPDTNLDKVWQVQGGLFLTAFYAKNPQRADVSLVDPNTGDRQLLAEKGVVAAVGASRFMGMFHFDEGRGDLTVTAIDTGEQTKLAPEFTVTAFAEQQGADLLAPGTRIVYEFKARTASPYDGIWIANSP